MDRSAKSKQNFNEGRLRVEYEVPVSVIVNLETGEVEKVAVWAEDIDGPKTVLDANGNRTASNDASRRAREIAESSEWPAWSF